MTKQILLTQGKFALVDDDVFDYLNQWKWFTQKSGKTYYAARRSARINGSPQGIIFIHRLIMDAPSWLCVDHIDGNGLNNQRSNLRLATKTQNSKNRRKDIDNTSGYKGVSWQSRDKRWQANIVADGKQIYLGYFSNPEDAARAYDKAARKYHGEFASLNFESIRQDG